MISSTYLEMISKLRVALMRGASVPAAVSIRGNSTSLRAFTLS